MANSIALSQETALPRIQKLIRNSDEVGLAVGLLNKGGFALVKDDFHRLVRRGGKLKILLGTDMATEPDAIADLLSMQERSQGLLELRRFSSDARSTFHPKLWVFSKRGKHVAAVIGSSNLTQGGYKRNQEANALIESVGAQDLGEYFDAMFEGGRAKDVNRNWLQKYREIFLKMQEANRALESLNDTARKIGLSAAKGSFPDKIKGSVFVFTGKIGGWPRLTKLYPKVRALGGKVTEFEGMGRTDCLVHGDLAGNQQTTRKLRRARKDGICIINQSEFLDLVEKEENLRRKRR